MKDISLPAYDKCRAWIKNVRENGVEWDKIYLGRKEDEEGLQKFLDTRIEEDFWPTDLDTGTWKAIVKTEESAEHGSKTLEDAGDRTIITDERQDNEVFSPTAEDSSWVLYKNHLLGSGWKQRAVDEIEESTERILKRLSKDTSETGPIKGLVIGHVQSGKTANMAGLMAMAADWGWNFFVVLSGTIENLRKQTQNRLQNDLNHKGNLYWQGLEHLSRRSQDASAIQMLRLEDGSRARYFTVCLKNATRLKGLIEWMHKDPNKYRQLKMLVIDDEADQASVNTADIESDERAKINSLIVNLVEGNGPGGQKLRDKNVRAKAVNYISYTATPYANFLNESTPESLYPKNFIGALNPSSEYFGPGEIFGIDGREGRDGLDIVREITESEREEIRDLHSGNSASIPESMKDAVAWFMCGAAAMRIQGHRKPVSMLVHTSQKQSHHSEVSEAIRSWIKNSPREVLVARCRSVWHRETARFSKPDLRHGYPDYGAEDAGIMDYPEFEDIESGIAVLAADITSIPLDEEGDLTYESHVHLCIDNCDNKNGLDEEGMHIRLAYPDPKSDPYPSPAPAFIVVGGNTLSRGLTIEGLISTYFLRGTCQADTLMQMGRWFGYRKGYELIPRIWMTPDTQEKFKFLAELEQELRDDLYRFSVLGESPLAYGPRVKNSPKASWLRVTSKNKMQSAEEIEIDFAGVSTQTTIFDNDKSILESNIETTESFLGSLGFPEISPLKNAVVWRGVDFGSLIESYLRSFKFKSGLRVFSQIEELVEWIKKAMDEELLEDWNVIVAGAGDVSDGSKKKVWEVGGVKIGKVNRSRKILSSRDNDVLNIGVLRGPRDMVADVPEDSGIDLNSGGINNADIEAVRKAARIDKQPQLIIYMIDKDSKPRESAQLRENLGAVEDIVGICVNVPGMQRKGPSAKALTVRLKRELITDEESWGEE